MSVGFNAGTVKMRFSSGSDSPSSSTPEEGDTEDDGQAVSVFITSVIYHMSGSHVSEMHNEFIKQTNIYLNYNIFIMSVATHRQKHSILSHVIAFYVFTLDQLSYYSHLCV